MRFTLLGVGWGGVGVAAAAAATTTIAVAAGTMDAGSAAAAASVCAGSSVAADLAEGGVAVEQDVVERGPRPGGRAGGGQAQEPVAARVPGAVAVEEGEAAGWRPSPVSAPCSCSGSIGYFWPV